MTTSVWVVLVKNSIGQMENIYVMENRAFFELRWYSLVISFPICHIVLNKIYQLASKTIWWV